MENKLLTGVWRYLVGVPPLLWEKQIEKARHKVKKSARFMSPDHRRVHHYVVRELPRFGAPLPAETVSRELALPLERTVDILRDLEEHLTFLYRNGQGEVVWAYPVTMEKTPHKITFGSGESLYAAWAVDAFATPFVQGRLRQENVPVTVDTECAHCRRPMQLEIDSAMNWHCPEADCRPVIFVPEVDFSRLEDPSIIEAFWKESVFFRSEEHARAHRRQGHRVRGAYFTPAQIAHVNRAIQSAIFGW